MFNNFKVKEYAIRYTNFVPKLYNLCIKNGFKQGKIIPSRAFCSDETQGYPIILLTKHFATFPFNHGRVGGILAGHDYVERSHIEEFGVIPAVNEFIKREELN